MAAALPGCQAFHPLEGVPAGTLSDAFRTPVRSPRTVIDLSLLGQPRPAVYRYDTGDVIGVFVNTLLGPEGIDPPPTIAETTRNLIPGLGYPFLVGRDGTIDLPELGPVFVRGLTKAELTNRLKELSKANTLGPEDDPDEVEDPVVLVSTIKERTIRVVVFRDELGPDGAVDNNTTGIGGARFDTPTGQVVDLPAYENDVLHALAATGGPPSLEGDTTITVTRAGGLKLLGCGPGGCAPGPAGPPIGGAPGLFGGGPGLPPGGDDRRALRRADGARRAAGPAHDRRAAGREDPPATAARPAAGVLPPGRDPAGRRRRLRRGPHRGRVLHRRPAGPRQLPAAPGHGPRRARSPRGGAGPAARRGHDPGPDGEQQPVPRRGRGGQQPDRHPPPARRHPGCGSRSTSATPWSTPASGS